MNPSPATTVQLLYFNGCPNYEELSSRLRAIVEAAGSGATLEIRAVESEDDIHLLRFLGSPTVRVNGHDVEPGAGARDDFGLKCRLYRTSRGVAAVPPEDWILAAIRKSREGLAVG